MQDDESISRRILDHISEIVYQVDGNPLSGTVVFVSKQVEEILGYRAEEFIQDPNFWFQLLHPEDMGGVIESTRQIIATREQGLRAYRLRHKNSGEYLWVEDKVVPQVDASGQVIGIWGVARDISARKHHETERLALHQVEEAIWRMDTPPDIEKVLGAIRTALEMARIPFQTCGVNVVDTTSEPTQISTYNTDGRASWKGVSLPGAEVILQIWRAGRPAYRRDLEQEDPYQERANIERSFGHPVRSVLDIPFARGTLAVNSPQPEAFSDAHLAFFQELAQVLSEGFRRLEDLRGRAQAERALEEHRTMTVRTDRLRFLGQMAAGMAHELSQPLQGVRGQAEHLLIGMERGWKVQKAQFREKLQSIIAQTDRMVHIIEHLRIFAREAGRSTRRLVQVGEVIHAAVSLLEAQFRSRGVEMEFDLGTTPLLVVANPFSLEEVILNLLTNARDAVEERGQTGLVPPSPQIAVRAWAEGEGTGPRVRIEVLDQGVGIPEAILGQIFDPFFTTKSPDRGTGLGLSICKALVEEVGGSIAIQSTVGQGTQVSLSLPAANTPRES